MAIRVPHAATPVKYRSGWRIVRLLLLSLCPGHAGTAQHQFRVLGHLLATLWEGAALLVDSGLVAGLGGRQHRRVALTLARGQPPRIDLVEHRKVHDPLGAV